MEFKVNPRNVLVALAALYLNMIACEAKVQMELMLGVKLFFTINASPTFGTALLNVFKELKNIV
tara:strand:+ start:549 stop:740 length:192 start_codon:yes stop_codon:yes gene_type:complete